MAGYMLHSSIELIEDVAEIGSSTVPLKKNNWFPIVEIYSPPPRPTFPERTSRKTVEMLEVFIVEPTPPPDP
jgi:hypothetical protein